MVYEYLDKQIKVLNEQLKTYDRETAKWNAKEKWDLNTGRKFNDLLSKYPISETELLDMSRVSCEFVTLTKITEIDEYFFINKDRENPRLPWMLKNSNTINNIYISNNDLEIINGFARTALKEDDIYTFDFILCDNEVDRDMERFSDIALEDVAEMFVRVTNNQSARIFKAKCITKEETETSLGMPYKFVKASAYMVRTQKNKDLIAEIEGGVKKEVSIGCRVDKKLCSICKKEVKGDCDHKKGSFYKNELCYHVLDNVGDVYEWSFVVSMGKHTKALA